MKMFEMSEQVKSELMNYLLDCGATARIVNPVLQTLNELPEVKAKSKAKKEDK